MRDREGKGEKLQKKKKNSYKHEKIMNNISSIISIFKRMTWKRIWNLKSDLVLKNAYTDS